jgi:hypothetical protein
VRTRSQAAATISLLALVVAPPDLEGQRFVAVPPPPDQPSAEGFDPERAIFFAEPNFTPWRDPDWRPLRDALEARDIAEDTPVLVFEAGGRTLTLVSSQMSYHHVAQGEMAGEPWMVTF